MNDGPGRKPTVTDDEILNLFMSSEDPVLTTREIADDLEIGRRGALKRLKDLEDRGFLKSKEHSGKHTVWWYPGHTTTKPVRPE
ncbi:HTH domain-containing protein [Natronomonas sp. CBA1123]|jgi:predicted ArsR family transcriptional regulator|uniref:winged helix-turn-helix domain-containing protein n=1 Tax=Natronomonas sp. CBA1123 TaxID=2668070 RepID=UPI0012EA240D|nr:winged helix-turn-helix domain-containing protein [Natronomonas sp. CBA1123]MUV85529.1 HTH domain-containing protein [Natronomonas sp. CBA1123]